MLIQLFTLQLPIISINSSRPAGIAASESFGTVVSRVYEQSVQQILNRHLVTSFQFYH
jgi:hypothetical protein